MQQTGSGSIQFPSRLPPPIPPPDHFLFGISGIRHANAEVQLSPDVNTQSENMHQAQIEDHVRSIHSNYKEILKQKQELEKIKVSQIKFKSDEVNANKTNNENIQTINMPVPPLPKSDEASSDNTEVIFQFNNSIDDQGFDQRHDVFDPNGQVDWGAGEMGGFLTGQTNVIEPDATQKELKEQTQCSGGVKSLQNSWSD